MKPDLDAIEARANFAAHDVMAYDREHGTYLFAYSQDIPALLEYCRELEAERRVISDRLLALEITARGILVEPKP